MSRPRGWLAAKFIPNGPRLPTVCLVCSLQSANTALRMQCIIYTVRVKKHIEPHFRERKGIEEK